MFWARKLTKTVIFHRKKVSEDNAHPSWGAFLTYWIDKVWCKPKIVCLVGEHTVSAAELSTAPKTT